MLPILPNIVSLITATILSIYTLILAFLPTPAYIEGTDMQPASFLPNQAHNQNEKTISSLIYRGLFKYDIYGAIIPDLAETWSVSDDGLTYTIKIKDNQYWSNGQKITSNDLIYTAFNFPDLTGVATDKVDDLTVRYTLPNKYAPFLSLMTIGIMPAHAVEQDNPLFPVSNGDFRIARVQRSGKIIKQITLVTTESKYEIKKMDFKYYSNEDELATAAKLGEITAFLSSDEYKLENFYDFKFPLQGIYYALFFNLRSEKLQDLVVRQKLEKVLPVDKLIAPYGIRAQGPISRSLFTDRAVEVSRYDSKFKDSLGDVHLTITVPDISAHVLLAKQIQSLWESNLGISVDLKVVKPEDIVSQVIEPRDFEVLLYGQEVGRDPDRYVLWHSAQKNPPGLNITGFDQVRADRALEAGREELDNEKRVVHYNEFQKSLTEQVPAVFLYHPFTHYYVSKYFTGIGEKYTHTYSDRFLDFENWHLTRTN